MDAGAPLSRRSLVLGVAGAGAAGVVGRPTATAASTAAPAEPLWRTAWRNGVVYGSAMSTRLRDRAYRRQLAREAAILLTEDDLLWYKLKPTPRAALDFRWADRLFDLAERQDQLVLAGHLVWDEGFGPGWPDGDLWGLTAEQATDLLYPTVRAMARRYRDRTAGWIAANEVTDPHGRRGYRTDVPWWNTIEPSYVADVFSIAYEEDPGATLMLNEFGFETGAKRGGTAVDRQHATLRVIDQLLADGVPMHALGVQAHLLADGFATRFDPAAYRRFLSEVAGRGLAVVVTELDVLDSGLPADPAVRDRVVGDCYRRYLDATLAEPAVGAVLTFGISDRYTWLEEDYPRPDGAHRRPLPLDRRLRPKPARHALASRLRAAPRRGPLWLPPGPGGPA